MPVSRLDCFKGGCIKCSLQASRGLDTTSVIVCKDMNDKKILDVFRAKILTKTRIIQNTLRNIL